MKKIILSIAFIIILIILPLSLAYNLNYSIEKHQDAISESKINYPDDIYEWQDGTFSGTWSLDNQGEQGEITGYILKETLKRNFIERKVSLFETGQGI